jgi:hypothetical protein
MEEPNMITETIDTRPDAARPAPNPLAPLTPRSLADLAAHRGPSLSLLLPTPWRGVEARQIAIALKDLLREAQEQARARGLPDATAAALLDPVRELVDDADFWRAAGEGAALFATPGELRSFRLGAAPAPRAVVGERFYLRPLLAPIDAPAFHLLGVSRHRVRLLEGDRESLRELDLGPVPGDFEAALGELQFHRGLQQHSATPAGLGRRAIVFHGHGADDEEHLEDDLFKYFRLLADALRERLGDDDRPLVVAAVEEHLPVLLQRAGLPGTVLAEGIAGNPDYLSERELHARAWPLVEAWARRAAAVDVERVRDATDRARVATETSAIVRAAAGGRIDTLLTAAGAELWGTFDPAAQALAVHAAAEPGDEELINLAACETLAARGAVRELPPAELPGPGPMAALLRW